MCSRIQTITLQNHDTAIQTIYSTVILFVFDLILIGSMSSTGTSGIPESVSKVQVSHIRSRRITCKYQSILQNFFGINLFLLLRVSRIQ